MSISFRKYSQVIKFIRSFKQFDTGEVTTTFTNGYCYYFALILHTRFPKSSIVYYAVGRHFACKIDGRVFDITGDITNKNLFFEDWEEYKKIEPIQSARIQKDCIDKIF